MQDFKPCGTAISWLHISAVSCQPRCRAASAGYSAFRSGVVVNHTLAISSRSMLLAATSLCSRSDVASRIASGVLALAVVAPRTPRQVMDGAVFGGWWLFQPESESAFELDMYFFLSIYEVRQQKRRGAVGP